VGFFVGGVFWFVLEAGAYVVLGLLGDSLRDGANSNLFFKPWLSVTVWAWRSTVSDSLLLVVRGNNSSSCFFASSAARFRLEAMFKDVGVAGKDDAEAVIFHAPGSASFAAEPAAAFGDAQQNGWRSGTREIPT